MPITEIKDANFDDLVMNSHRKHLILFTADFSVPCKEYTTILTGLAEDKQADFDIGKVDVMQNLELRKRYDIRILPTTIIFDKGDIVKREIGILSSDSIKAIINVP